MSIILVTECVSIFVLTVYNNVIIASDEFFTRTYHFNLEEVEGFRYRAKDAWRAVTRIAVREARLKEIKEEMLNNTRLKV